MYICMICAFATAIIANCACENIKLYSSTTVNTGTGLSDQSIALWSGFASFRSWAPWIWDKMGITTLKCLHSQWLAEQAGTILSNCGRVFFFLFFIWNVSISIFFFFLQQHGRTVLLQSKHTTCTCQSQILASFTWGTCTSHHIDSMTRTLNTRARLLSRGLKLGSRFMLN